MTRLFHPPELEHPRQRNRFDPLAEGKRYGLSRELSLAIWKRVSEDSTDIAGRCNEEQARQRFHDLAARIAARGGRLRPDPGRVTRVGVEINGESPGTWAIDELRPRVPGRQTLVAVEARRWAKRETPTAGDAATSIAGEASALVPIPKVDEEMARRELPGASEIAKAIAALQASPRPHEATPLDISLLGDRSTQLGFGLMRSAEVPKVSATTNSMQAVTEPNNVHTAFDAYRVPALKEVLKRIGPNQWLRQEFIAATSAPVRSIAGTRPWHEPLAGTPMTNGHALWHVAERYAATLYRRAVNSRAIDQHDPAVESALQRRRAGQPLTKELSREVEREFGVSLAGVRIHTDAIAAQAARALDAEAFTIGEDIFFAEGTFAPDTRSGRKLLTHELTHVAQALRGDTGPTTDGLRVSQPGEPLEQQADATANAIVDHTTNNSAPLAQVKMDRAPPAGGAWTGHHNVVYSGLQPTLSVTPAAIYRKANAVKQHANGGFAQYGGPSVREYLTQLVEQGRLHITGKQIALLDAVAQVETGGKIGCVQTYDDQIVSVGFKQVVLGHGSLEKMMKRAPAGFARHGLKLDPSRKYTHPGWSNHPSQIEDCEDENELRKPEWALRFYEASMEPDVVAAMCEFALGEAADVERAAGRHAVGIDRFADPTAEGWLLETKNNRPAFMPVAIQKAVAAGAGSAASREAFLDILAGAIVDAYIEQEPLLWYRKTKEKAKTRKIKLTADQDAALLEEMKRIYEPVGKRKATHITTKIKRNLIVPKVGDEPAHAPAPAPAHPAAPAHRSAAIHPPVVNSTHDDDALMLSLPEAEVLQSIAPAAQSPEPLQSIAPVAHAPEPLQSIAPDAQAPEPLQSIAPVAQAPSAATHSEFPDHHELPVPEHGDDLTSPEKVTKRPVTAPARPAGRAIYQHGGVLSKEHLHRFKLDDQQFEFKLCVYDVAVARLGDKIYGGVAKEDLVRIDEGKEIRHDVAGPVDAMLSAMRADIKAGKAAGNRECGQATGIHVMSAYRSPEHDRDLWDKYFQRYLAKTTAAREATGEPYGAKAVQIMVSFIASRKAPPGGSNHSNGTAVDLTPEVGGASIVTRYDNQTAWRNTWHYEWLKANAARFGFKNYRKEAWHWDYKG